MALTAYIEFGNNDSKRYFKQYMISDCYIVNEKPFNKFCPEGNASCERLEVSIISPGRDDLDLYEWYDTQNCFRLSEHYDASTNRRRIIKLAIEAEKICIDEVEFKRI